MIQRALTYIANELTHGLDLDISEVNLNRLQKIHEKKEQGLVISLMNVEEEKTLKNTPHYTRKNDQLYFKQPAICLNLNVIMAFEFPFYGKSLQVMSETVEFFQTKKYFSPDNDRLDYSFPEELQRLILELQPLSFEQMNHIWGISGGAFFPSLLYKVRLVKITPKLEKDKNKRTEINTIQLNSALEEI